MARPIQQKCLDCSRLTQAEAIALHGPGTKTGCWKLRTCRRMRSHYLNRIENIGKLRGVYQAKKTAGQDVEVAEEIFVPVQAPPVALLYLFREDRKDAHLHAVAGAVWQGDRKLADVKPQHCLGLQNRHVNQYLRNVLAELAEKYGVVEFLPEIRMEPSECPIEHCPLKEKFR